LGWPVNSEKSEGRSVSSNAASGLFKVEMGRSAIAYQHGETQNQRQGQRNGGADGFPVKMSSKPPFSGQFQAKSLPKNGWPPSAVPVALPILC
jgi:hypothetical protein